IRRTCLSAVATTLLISCSWYSDFVHIVFDASRYVSSAMRNTDMGCVVQFPGRLRATVIAEGWQSLAEILIRVLDAAAPSHSARCKAGAAAKYQVNVAAPAVSPASPGRTNRRAGVASGKLDWRTRTSLGRKG